MKARSQTKRPEDINAALAARKELHQPAVLEAQVLEMRRAHPFWGPRRIVVELRRAGVAPAGCAPVV
mgnify:CR=1 FL=1